MLIPVGEPVAVPVTVDYRFHFDYAVVDEREGATAAGTLYGRVEDTSGIPVPHATVILTPRPPLDVAPRTIITNDEGKFDETPEMLAAQIARYSGTMPRVVTKENGVTMIRRSAAARPAIVAEAAE